MEEGRTERKKKRRRRGSLKYMYNVYHYFLNGLKFCESVKNKTQTTVYLLFNF